jgi:hypothetical protein
MEAYIGVAEAQPYPLLNLGARRGWVVNARPRPLYPRERDPVPIVQESEWAPGPVWTGAKNLALTGIRYTERPVCSESLHRLSYRGTCLLGIYVILIGFIDVSNVPMRLGIRRSGVLTKIVNNSTNFSITHH